MSHFTEIETTFKSGECLLAALADIGFGPDKVEVHDIPQLLDGYDKKELRGEVAHIIIRKKHLGPCSNDIGFIKTPIGTYKILMSDFNSGLGVYDKKYAQYGTEWMQKLKQRYSYRMLLRTAAQQGLACVHDSTVSLGVGR